MTKTQEPEQCEECATDLRDDEGIHCDKCQAELDAWFHSDRSEPVTPEAEAWHESLMFPRTAAFFAEHAPASAVRAEPDELWCRCGIGAPHKRGHGIGEAPKRVPPTLCPAVCRTHHRGCALHLAPYDEHVTPKHRDPAWHLCNGGGMPHEFYAAPA